MFRDIDRRFPGLLASRAAVCVYGGGRQEKVLRAVVWPKF